MALGLVDEPAVLEPRLVFERVGEQLSFSSGVRKSSIVTWFGVRSLGDVCSGACACTRTGGLVCKASKDVDMNEQAAFPPSIGNCTMKAGIREFGTWLLPNATYRSRRIGEVEGKTLE